LRVPGLEPQPKCKKKKKNQTGGFQRLGDEPSRSSAHSNTHSMSKYSNTRLKNKKKKKQCYQNRSSKVSLAKEGSPTSIRMGSGLSHGTVDGSVRAAIGKI
jgi:hypothetical protein